MPRQRRQRTNHPEAIAIRRKSRIKTMRMRPRARSIEQGSFPARPYAGESVDAIPAGVRILPDNYAPRSIHNDSIGTSEVDARVLKTSADGNAAVPGAAIQTAALNNERQFLVRDRPGLPNHPNRGASRALPFGVEVFSGNIDFLWVDKLRGVIDLTNVPMIPGSKLDPFHGAKIIKGSMPGDRLTSLHGDLLVDQTVLNRKIASLDWAKLRNVPSLVTKTYLAKVDQKIRDDVGAWARATFAYKSHIH